MKVFIVLLISVHTTSAQICASEVQCPEGSKCVASSLGYSLCSKIGGGAQVDYPTPPSFYCNTDKDCAASQICVHPPQGIGICQESSSVICVSNDDCRDGETCVMLPNLRTTCQITVGGYVQAYMKPVQVGGIGLSCQRDSDCGAQQRCVDYHGQWKCMATIDLSECHTSLDCAQGKICAYSTFVSRNICVDPANITVGGNVGSGSGASPTVGGNVGLGSGTKPTIGGNIGSANAYMSNGILQGGYAKFPTGMDQNTILNEDENATTVTTEPFVIKSSTTTSAPIATIGKSEDENKVRVLKTRYAVMRQPQIVPKQAVIDPAALPCEFDYQCRMGESCSSVITLVDRNITVCQYDVTKEDRMCIYHADCLQGQLCTRNKTGTYVCTASIEAALGTVACTYDYECSGGEKCTNIADQGKEKVFRCRQSPYKDPRHDQPCRTNAECPYQQVCRRVAGVALCVDIVASTDPAAMLNLQRKVVKFVQDLIFARI